MNLPHLRFLPSLSLAVLILIVPPTAMAITRTVTVLSDSGPGSLRETIPASAAGDTIIFSVSGVITLTGGEIVIGRNLTILGPAAGLVLSGHNSNRVFNIVDGTVNISHLTFSNAVSLGTNGPMGVDESRNGGAGGKAQGGAIFNSGTLTLTNCTLTDNYVVGGRGGGSYCCDISDGGAGGEGQGGGIYNQGTMALINCTLHANAARGGAGGSGFARGGLGGFAFGGAIYNQGTLSLANCTLSGNSSIGGDSGDGFFSTNGPNANGGALYQPGSASFLNTVVAGNTVTAGSGYPVGTGFGTTAGPDISGAVSSSGHNFIGKTDGSSGWVASDLTGTIIAPFNPLLGPLQNNGGPTPTLALQSTSAAIDVGDDIVLGPPLSLGTDQRGHPRRLGPHVDIGAYEFGLVIKSVTSNSDSGPGSLRNSIAEADPSATILFADHVRGAIILTTGPLNLSGNLTITGPGADRLTLQVNDNSQLIEVSNVARINISGLTFKNFASGRSSSSGVPCLTVDLSSTLSLDACVVTGFLGTGINNLGQLSINRCAIFGNSGFNGGGIENLGTATIANSTISGNQANEGGGIYNDGTLTLISSTVCSNSTSGAGTNQGGGGFYNHGIGTVRSCIIAGNAIPVTAMGPDCNGSFTSMGYNLIGKTNGSTGFSAFIQDQVGTLAAPLDPKVGPLSDDGGSTPAMALLIGSPAIDKGISAAGSTDQRGGFRSFDKLAIANASEGDGTDIGAFEVGSFVRMTSVRKVGNDIRASFTTDLGNNYTVQRRDNAAFGTWTPVANNVAGSGTIVTVTNTPAAGSTMGFYRVLLVP